MQATISILFSLLPFIFITYYFIVVRKTKYISLDLKSGKRCYSCKDSIDLDQMEYLDILVRDKKNYRLCHACQREEKLDGLINKNKSSILHKFNLKLIDERFDKTTKILLFSIIFLLVIDITLKIVFGIKWFSYFYNIFLALYWILIIYRYKLISIKKPSH
jgi:hypothetical protein